MSFITSPTVNVNGKKLQTYVKQEAHVVVIRGDYSCTTRGTSCNHLTMLVAIWHVEIIHINYDWGFASRISVLRREECTTTLFSVMPEEGWD